MAAATRGWFAMRESTLRDALAQFSAQGERLRIIYSTRSPWFLAPTNRPAHIAVLDASFNPPTRAHAALAQLPRPGGAAYDMHLLIFSVRNADKGRGRPGDASPSERLVMMELLARYLERDGSQIAIALVDEPLVFAKAKILLDHINSPVPLHLHWLMCSDTITRVFNQKYYGGDAELRKACDCYFSQGSYITCAERSSESAAGIPGPSRDAPVSTTSELHALLASPGPAHDYWQQGRIDVQALDPEVAPNSSTAVRRYLQEASRNQTPEAEVVRELMQMVPETLVPYLVERKMYY